MLGGFMKITLSVSVLCLFINLVWQTSIANALPTLEGNIDMVKANDDPSTLFESDSHTGANVIRSSLHSTINQPSRLINRHDFPSALKNKHFRKISHSKKFSPNLFQSTGSNKQQLRAAKRIKAILENRLKRFRMLDQDEFQEMLKSLSQQTADEQTKSSDAIDALGGMQLANYWSPV